MLTPETRFVHLFVLIFAATSIHAANQSLGWPGKTLEGKDCYGKQQGYGPFDYRQTTPASRRNVERRHFTPEVEQLIRGKSTHDVLADLAYTLNVYPNHHRALWSVSRYYLGDGAKRRTNTNLDQSQATPPECYFRRAMRFVPDDPMVPAVFGIYLHRLGRTDAAHEMYLQAESLNSRISEVAYNLGLLYFDMGDYEKSRAYSQKAKELGYPLRGLERKLHQLSDSSPREHRTETRAISDSSE